MDLSIFKKISFFNRNEYFDQYLQLISENLNTPMIKGKTERHHVIPLIIYQLNSGVNCSRKEAEIMSVQQDANFTVNMMYKDHVLAHYYLALCCADRYKSSLLKAFSLMTFNKYRFLDEVDKKQFLEELDNYQELFEEFIIRIREQSLNRPLKTETKEKISKALLGQKKGCFNEKHKKALKNARDFHSTTKGKKSIYSKELDKVKFVSEEELERYLENGWQLGSRPLSKEAKEKISKSNSITLKGKAKIKNHGLENNKVMCIEEGLIFNNLTEAKAWLFNKTGVDGGQIKNVCAGKRKQTGGYHWKYIK